MDISHRDEPEEPAKRHYTAHVTVELGRNGTITAETLLQAVAQFQHRIPPWASVQLMGTKLYAYWWVLAENLPALGPDVAP